MRSVSDAVSSVRQGRAYRERRFSITQGDRDAYATVGRPFSETSANHLCMPRGPPPPRPSVRPLRLELSRCTRSSPLNYLGGVVVRGYRRRMPVWAWIAFSGAAVVIVAAAVMITGWRRRRRPLTAQEQLLAARKAMRGIRRETRRPDYDHFHKGGGVPDRHSAAIAENAVYGDLSGGSGGSI